MKSEASRSFTDYNFYPDKWLTQESSILMPKERMRIRHAESPFWIKVKKLYIIIALGKEIGQTQD